MTESAPSDVSDGPVLSLINKRIRALRKKYNRILQTEQSLALGKPINKEQQQSLQSKPSVAASIDELEKLRQPLANAVSEEITLAAAPSHDAEPIESLLNLLYFATMFDVKNKSDFTKIMLTRAHERGCCLTYDYVTDDEDGGDDLLVERDLDLIAKLGALFTARPAESVLSHKDALERCLEHVRLWLSGSDQPIDSDPNVTYAGLRAKLMKIMGSDFFTITPKVTVEMAVAAVGNYASFPDLAPSSVEPVGIVVGDGHSGELSEEKDKNTPDSQVTDNHEEEVKFGDLNQEVAQIKSDKLEEVEGKNMKNSESKEQNHAPRRNYQNQRGGRGGGYFNGRGSRGGRRGGRPYQNSQNQYYYVQVGDHNPRSNHDSRGRGRGGTGGGRNIQNNHSVGVQSG